MSEPSTHGQHTGPGRRVQFSLQSLLLASAYMAVPMIALEELKLGSPLIAFALLMAFSNAVLTLLFLSLFGREGAAGPLLGSSIGGATGMLAFFFAVNHDSRVGLFELWSDLALCGAITGALLGILVSPLVHAVARLPFSRFWHRAGAEVVARTLLVGIMATHLAVRFILEGLPRRMNDDASAGGFAYTATLLGWCGTLIVAAIAGKAAAVRAIRRDAN